MHNGLQTAPLLGYFATHHATYQLPLQTASRTTKRGERVADRGDRRTPPSAPPLPQPPAAAATPTTSTTLAPLMIVTMITVITTTMTIGTSRSSSGGSVVACSASREPCSAITRVGQWVRGAHRTVGEPAASLLIARTYAATLESCRYDGACNARVFRSGSSVDVRSVDRALSALRRKPEFCRQRAISSVG